MGLVSFLVFLVLQVVFLPIAIVGVLLIGYEQMVVSRRLKQGESYFMGRDSAKGPFMVVAELCV